MFIVCVIEIKLIAINGLLIEKRRTTPLPIELEAKWKVYIGYIN